MSSLDDRWLKFYEHVNIATCVAYVAAGWEGLARVQTLDGWVFAGWMVWLGISSAIYHARPFSLYALRLDQGGMYGTFVALAIYAVTGHPLAWAAALGIGVVVGFWLAGLDRVTVVSMTVLEPTMILLGGLVALAGIFNGSWLLAVTALGLLGIAWAAWHRPWGHGTWHLLTAVAILLLFLGVR